MVWIFNIKCILRKVVLAQIAYIFASRVGNVINSTLYKKKDVPRFKGSKGYITTVCTSLNKKMLRKS